MRNPIREEKIKLVGGIIDIMVAMNEAPYPIEWYGEAFDRFYDHNNFYLRNVYDIQVLRYEKYKHKKKQLHHESNSNYRGS